MIHIFVMEVLISIPHMIHKYYYNNSESNRYIQMFLSLMIFLSNLIYYQIL